MFRVLSVIALLTFFPAAARAAEFSGDYLLSMCASDANGGELTPGAHTACQAYIAGIVDYHNLIHSLGTSPSVDFCVPESAAINELQAVVARYLYKNRIMHGKFTAAPAVAMALFAVYPCRGK